MITIPEHLKKYFLSPKSRLKNENKFYYEANKCLLEQMRCGVKTDIGSVSTTTRKTPEFFKITEDTCDHAFASACWEKLKDDEKARTIYIFIKKTIKEKYPNIPMPNLHFLISQELTQMNAEAMYYHKKNNGEEDFVFVKPEYLMNSNGLMLVNLISHELQHHYDFTMCNDKLLPHFQECYLSPLSLLSTTEKIIQLPISGNIKNYKTGKLETITPKLQEQILMLKHFMFPITSHYDINDISQVKTVEDMYALFEYQAYLNTPLEKRAYNTGLETAQAVAQKNISFNIPQSNVDTIKLQHIANGVENAERNAKIITKLTNVPMEQICDLFYKEQYYPSQIIKTPSIEAKISKNNKELISLIEKAFENYSQQEYTNN